MRRFRRNATAVLTAAAFLLGAAACGGDEEPQADPTDSTTSASPSEPTSSAPPSDAWKKEYTKKQLKAYQDALDRWEEYETRSEPIWSKGKATEAAADLFRQYFPSPNWQGQYRTLASYEQADAHIEGTPGIYWSRAKRISKNGLSVEINQCVDYTKVTSIQRGKEVSAPDWVSRPNLRTISLAKPKGYDWLIYSITDASSGKARRCKP